MFLFSWDSRNITATPKAAAYAHLYSYASAKSVVHWFQIMRESAFQIFDDDVAMFGGPANLGKAHRLARFPTRNIETPILLDTLVDIVFPEVVSALRVHRESPVGQMHNGVEVFANGGA